jgi:hypothetical protein
MQYKRFLGLGTCNDNTSVHACAALALGERRHRDFGRADHSPYLLCLPGKSHLAGEQGPFRRNERIGAENR